MKVVKIRKVKDQYVAESYEAIAYGDTVFLCEINFMTAYYGTDIVKFEVEGEE